MTPFKTLKIERSPSEQVIELLKANVIGTPGRSMVYKHKNVSEKIADTSNPFFANLSIRNRLYGTICLSKRNVCTFGKSHQAFYLRYFTFRESLRASNPNEKSSNSSSKIRDEVALLMNGAGLDFDGYLVLYAYVDSDNVRSRRLIEEFGFKKMGSFNVIPFSRFYPKINPEVQIVKKGQTDEISTLLKAYYKDEQLVFTDINPKKGNYFVMRSQGEIVCGVMATPDEWEIKELPGLSGKIMMRIVPKIPALGKLFQPQYKFVFLESIYCKEGFHEKLALLLESVLAHYKLSSGTICLDPKSKIYTEVKKLKLGLTQKIMGETEIDLVIKSTDMNMFNPDAAFYVSGQDVL